MASDTTDDRPSITELQRLQKTAIADRPDYIRHAAEAVLAVRLPVLLEIAATALALRVASKAAAKSRNAWTMDGHSGPQWEQFDRDDKVLHAAHAAWDAALAKVRQ